MDAQDIPFFTHDEAQLREMVRRIDPDLTFLADLHPAASTCRTLLVDQHGNKRSLKIRQISHNMWDDTYFNLELYALMRVEERHLEGVTHLVAHYRTDEYEALLKTFVEGTPCNNLESDSLLHDPAFINKLDKLYLKLHLAGIAKINFLPRKVVMDDQGELILVDLSSCVVNTEYGVGRFVQEMRDDSRFITGLERRARRQGATP